MGASVQLLVRFTDCFKKSGGYAEMARVIIAEEIPSVEDVIEALLEDVNVGCVICFVGVVRGVSKKGVPVDHLHIELGEEGARVLEELVQEAESRFGIRAIVYHRCGILKPGERIGVFAVAAKHRQEGFAALRWLIDELKARVHSRWMEEVVKQR